VGQIVDTVGRAVSSTVGLDAPLSNWAVVDGTLHYLDVTTPMLAEADGRSELDPALFLAAFPAPLRAPLRWFVAHGLLRRYHDPRHVLVDLCSVLENEGLVAWRSAFISAANDRLAARDHRPPITLDEVERYHAREQSLWSMLLGLRRADRWWQTTICGRAYPFLLRD
jgi:hypothetical protein